MSKIFKALQNIHIHIMAAEVFIFPLLFLFLIQL